MKVFFIRYKSSSTIFAFFLLLCSGLLAVSLDKIQNGTPLITEIDSSSYATCSALPCDHLLAKINSAKHRDIRLDIYQPYGAAVQIKWNVQQLGLSIFDAYPTPENTQLTRVSYLFKSLGGSGDVEIVLRMLNSHPFSYSKAVVFAESPLAVFSEYMKVALPVLLISLLALFFVPHKATPFVVVFFLMYCCYVVFAPSPKSGQMGDNRFYLPAAYELVRHGHLSLNNYTGKDSTHPFTILQKNKDDDFLNYYPAAVSIVIAPLVAWSETWLPPEERLADALAKIIAAASVAVFFLLCRRIGCTAGGSALLCGAFAFATSQFSIHAGGLYSHTITTFFALVALWILTLPSLTAMQALLLALLSVVGMACRHDFAFIILGCSITLLLRSRHLLFLYLGAMGALLVPTIYGANLLYGQWIPPYMLHHGPRNISVANLKAFAGLLISPNRGLFIYSPILAFGYIRAILAIAKPRKSTPLELGLAATTLSFLVLLTSFSMWWGGWSYGPRLFCSILGPLMVLTAMQLKDLVERPRGRALMVALLTLVLVWGAFVHTKGALIGDGWNGSPNNIDQHPERLWDVTDLQIFRDIKWLPILFRERILDFMPSS
ncbi:hypothetical protein GTA51_10285 [Desulfovibrio aerotolerans]|uniref:Glycosyltransferase RgtA/B/C/D-like domain-containing protein n=1 Tax=Solidesulfovibrio aerotolerans TaxID=295255 RepID=A0A7C9MPA0_9BACT|nr:hypothetical protein [Solidesulfovibrio aerotolerans]MYL83512.1 hypothetical protein [Solidesulfovibrio aerotolerans]